MDTTGDASHSLQECCACGLTQSTFASELSTPFNFQPFTHSPGASQAAWDVIEDGTDRISHLTKAMEKLSTIRDRVMQSVKYHRNLLAPINRLSDDILQRVFEHTTGRTTGNWGQAPWEVSAVCKRWRGTAVSHRYIWSEIQLSPQGEDTVKDLQRKCRRAEIQLDRSGFCELDVQVDFSSVKGWLGHKTIDSLLEKTMRYLLAASSCRCRYLQLTGSIPEHWQILPDPSVIHSQLRVLDIQGSSWAEKPFLLNTPALRTLHLHQVPVGIMKVRWGDLSRIHFTGCSGGVAVFLEVLQLAGSLQRLLFDNLRPAEAASDNTPAPLQSVRLPGLRELSLSFDPTHSPLAGSVIRHVTAPSVFRIKLLRIMAKDAQLLALEEFICNSNVGSSLQVLLVINCRLTTWMLPILKMLPELEELVIEGKVKKGNNTAVLVALSSHAQAVDNDILPLCPKLKRLVIKGDYVDMPHLKTAVLSRIRITAGDGGHSLHAFLEHVFVQADFPDMESDSSFDWFEDLKRNGPAGLPSISASLGDTRANHRLETLRSVSLGLEESRDGLSQGSGRDWF